MPPVADRISQQIQLDVTPQRSTVVDFASVKRQRLDGLALRFSMVDRMTAHGWADTGRELGYLRLAFETATEIDGAPGGEYLLIYRDSAWSAWGIGCCSEGLILWHAPRGTTIGHFQNMQHALDRIRTLTPMQ